MNHTYDDNIEIWKKAYQNILEACEKYQNFDNKYSFYDIDTMRHSAKNHLLLIEWYEKYGLKLSHDYKPMQYHHFKVNEYMAFSYFQDGDNDKDNRVGKYISWSDDGRQPSNEWLLCISFPTGAYIFGEDYAGQQQLFQSFISELKSYNPDYSDTVNKSFYWKLENAKSVFEDFSDVLQKYRERNKSELNKRKAEKLRKELEALEETMNP